MTPYHIPDAGARYKVALLTPSVAALSDWEKGRKTAQASMLEEGVADHPKLTVVGPDGIEAQLKKLHNPGLGSVI